MYKRMLGKESDQHPIKTFQLFLATGPVITLTYEQLCLSTAQPSEYSFNDLENVPFMFFFFSEHTKSASHSRDRWGSSWDNQCFTITKQGVSNR